MQMKGEVNMSTQTNMTRGNPTKLLLNFAIPLMLGTIFQQSFILVDRIIVGHLIGANAFSSVGATGSISMVFTSLCLGIAIGSGIVVSQFYGANDEDGTASAIRNGTMISILSTIIVSILALVVTRPILILLNTSTSLKNLHTDGIPVFIYLSVKLYFAVGNQWIWNKCNRGVYSDKPDRKSNPTTFYSIGNSDGNLYRTKYWGGKD